MKIQLIKREGLVLETLLSSQFKLRLDDGKEIRAYLSGRMRTNKIRVLANDTVVIELSPNMPILNQIGRIIKRK